MLKRHFPDRTIKIHLFLTRPYRQFSLLACSVNRALWAQRSMSRLRLGFWVKLTYFFPVYKYDSHFYHELWARTMLENSLTMTIAGLHISRNLVNFTTWTPSQLYIAVCFLFFSILFPRCCVDLLWVLHY